MKRFLLTCALLITASCAKQNPVVTAAGASPEYRAETIAFALHNSFVVVAERAASIAESPNTPDGVKRQITTLYENAAPVARRLREAALEYNRVREALAAGTGTAEDVAIALSELNRLLTEAAPKIDRLATEIGGGS